MDSFELDLHRLILDQLAESLVYDTPRSDSKDVQRLLSKCPPILDDSAKRSNELLLTLRDQNSIAALARFTTSASQEWKEELVPKLLAYLDNLPLYSFEESNTWKKYSPPDEFTYILVTELMKTASKGGEYVETIRVALWAYAEKLHSLLRVDDAEYTVTFILPSLNGFFRSLQEYPFRWNFPELAYILKHMRPLLQNDTLTFVRNGITTVLNTKDHTAYSRRLLAKYWEDKPLSNNRVILDMLRLMRNVLGRIMVGPSKHTNHVNGVVDKNTGEANHSGEDIEECFDMSKSFSELWEFLTSHIVKSLHSLPSPDIELVKLLRSLYVMSLTYYDDIKQFSEKCFAQGKEGSPDAYWREIMATSLQLAALCAVYLHEVDDVLVTKMTDSLFDIPHTSDLDVQMASLDVAALLSINFPETRQIMISTIRKFLTTPSTIFEFAVATGPNGTIQQYAIKRLAQAIQTRSDGQMHNAAQSVLYSLLNHVAAIYDDDPSSHEKFPHSEEGEVASDDVKKPMTDLEKQQVCSNALAAISGVAIHLRDNNIMESAFAILGQRGRLLSTPLGVVILEKLTDLALAGPSNVFTDVVTLFANISKKTVTSETKAISTAVLNCQTSLARRISKRPDLYDLYLHNLLDLFVEKGNNIQRTVAQQSSKVQVSSLAAELGILLPVLRLLLSRKGFNPHIKASEDLISLFRNLWFHCVMYGFVSDNIWVREWKDSLVIIATKTPPIILESVGNIESDLEYNSVLRRGFSNEDLTNLRGNLTTLLPSNAYEIRSFKFEFVVFLLSVYHIETMRGKMGNCSAVLEYFANQGVLSSSLVGCIESIADKVISIFILDQTSKIVSRSADEELKSQAHVLFIKSCHQLKKVHSLAIRYADRLVSTFSQLLCDMGLLTLLLELVQLVWLSCDAEFRDEYCPTYEFTSSKVGVTLHLGDKYSYRRELFSKFYENTKKWLVAAIKRTPNEVSGLLQDYLGEFDQFQLLYFDTPHIGRTLALDVGRTVTANEPGIEFAPQITNVPTDNASDFINLFAARRQYRGETIGIKHRTDLHLTEGPDVNQSSTNLMANTLQSQLPSIKEQLATLMEAARAKKPITNEQLHKALYRAAGVLIDLPNVDETIVRYIVWIPVHIFTPESMRMATGIWDWVISQKASAEKRMMVEMTTIWSWCLRHRKGLFSPVLNQKHPFESKMTYAPSDKTLMARSYQLATHLFSPHLIWIQFLSSRFLSIRYTNRHLVELFLRLLQTTFDKCHLMSIHPLARECRFQLILLGLKVLQGNRMEALCEYKFRATVYNAAFNWFALNPRWNYGAKKTAILAEHRLLTDVYNFVQNDKVMLNSVVTSSSQKTSNSTIASGLYTFVADKTKDDITKQHQQTKSLLLLFLESELNRMAVWCNPLNQLGSAGNSASFVNNVEKTILTDDGWKSMVGIAWDISPALAVQLASRFIAPAVVSHLQKLIMNNPIDVISIPEALIILLGNRNIQTANIDLKYLLYWAPVPPITAANYFQPPLNNNSLVIQYAMRSLEYFPVEIVFFYVPQIVQALRYDELGYVERFIMEAGQMSQLFAHQIIWNMNANFYVDADKDCEKPDSLKPTLERIIENLVKSFTGDDKSFYEREFKFFGEVTAISGKLKEFIKFGQMEKKPMQKKKVDEELHKIIVDVGVYLPSNPDGIVIDIDRDSGRPLQSHAKAPFMATFKVRKSMEDAEEVREAMIKSGVQIDDEKPKVIEVMQSAIFKVGDDCRQDVLALQLIATFKNIFTNIGLDLYVFPYRVVATGPGCGVIDVIPRSISRDQLGREKVNNLLDYFHTRYGGAESIAFQKARNNFIQSVAAYSVISYLLQFKDRHNGNIMLDDDGHVIHIDFGFIFDIAPGGINFESSPFKLTAEMIQVMGGSAEVQTYKWFSELVVKAYLATRPYAEQIMQMVSLMLGSGLPCFKGETIKRMRTRFQLDKSERAAADFMMQRIAESFENRRTVLYDAYQRATNGIPY